MIKYVFAFLFGLVAFNGSLAAAPMQPGEVVYSRMLCKEADFIKELAELHATKGLEAVHEKIAEDRTKLTNVCVNFPMPVEVKMKEVVKDVMGPGGHIKVWIVTDPDETTEAFSVEFVDDTQLKRCPDCKEYKQDTDENFRRLKSSGKLSSYCIECIDKMITENKHKKAMRKLSPYV